MKRADLFDNIIIYFVPYIVEEDSCMSKINEKDFIDYLNRWVFPEYESRLVEDIGWIRSLEEIPPKYRGCPDFNF